MNGDKTATKQTDKTCPICQARYQTLIAAPAPTCGNPNCIREARERGLPFTPQLPLLPEKPKKPEKRKKGKAT